MRTWQLGTHPWVDPARGVPAGVRVIVDNDFAGDPDDLVQLAHHLLLPAVDVRAVISSHLAPGDPFVAGRDENSAEIGRERVGRLLEVMGCEGKDRVLLGTANALADRRTPVTSPGVEAIIREARADDDRPLLVAVGGGLTDVASAWLTAPDIAERLMVVWIGGPEYPDLAAPAPGDPVEYNLAIDVDAARVVLEDSDLPLWQVPRDAYRQCLVSDAELRTRLRPAGDLGRYLYAELERVLHLVAGMRGHTYGTYTLGDSPLVLLTALQTVFEPAPASCRSVVRPAMHLAEDGSRGEGRGRDVRVFTRLDTRLMFEDLFACVAEFAAWQGGNDDDLAPRGKEGGSW